ncbi:MAG: hypothetical protein NVSMB16_16930 [Acidimicrobiales bacterium]
MVGLDAPEQLGTTPKCSPGLHDGVCEPIGEDCGCGCGREGSCATQLAWRRVIRQLDDTTA